MRTEGRRLRDPKVRVTGRRNIHEGNRMSVGESYHSVEGRTKTKLRGRDGQESQGGDCPGLWKTVGRDPSGRATTPVPKLTVLRADFKSETVKDRYSRIG